MYFWLTLLLALTFAALYLADAAAEGDGSFTLTYLTVFGLGMVVAGVIRVLFAGGRPALLRTASWTLVLGAAVATLAYRPDTPPRGEALTITPVQDVTPSRTGIETELRRGWDGHYRADAMVNGADMRLLVDTGASMVLLPYEGVEALGFDPASLRYTVPVTTANGRSSVAPIRIDRITVGDIEVQDVSAAVAQPGALTMGLLGMTFLDRLSETVFRGDRLLLRQEGTGGAIEGRFKRAPVSTDPLTTMSVPKERPKLP